MGSVYRHYQFPVFGYFVDLLTLSTVIVTLESGTFSLSSDARLP